MDKRIIQSKLKIKEAYIAMLFKQEPDKIQVNELCKLAGVNRSTFYDRYGFLDNLENEVIEDELGLIADAEIQIDQLQLEAEGIKKDVIRRYIESFCNSKILRRYCLTNNNDKYINFIVQRQMKLCASALTKISYYEAYFQCFGAITIIIGWMNNKRDHTLEDIIDIVYMHSIAMFRKL